MNDFSVLLQMALDLLPFIKLCWPDMTLYDKQRDILQSIVAYP